MKTIHSFNKVLMATVIFLFASLMQHQALGQNAQTCEDIVLQIYQGVNQQKGKHLVPYLSKDFSMAGQKGELAQEIFPVFISSLKDKVTDIEKVSEKRTDVLTLVYEAKFEDMGVRKSTFVFDKHNKLILMDLLPTQVKHQKGK